jgi:hypothetical protein
MELELENAETVLKTGRADRVRGSFVRRGGYLWLTNRRLVYQSFFFFKVSQDAYRLDEIVTAQPANIFSFVLEGMSIQLRDGREEKFLVIGRTDWLAQIAKSQQAMPALEVVPSTGGQPRYARRVGLRDWMWIGMAGLAVTWCLLMIAATCCALGSAFLPGLAELLRLH